MDKGLKLLLATYWNEGIWGNNPPTEADYAQAKAEGYVFDPAPYRSHDETLHDLRRITAQIAAEDVANAFLYSLSTRELHYRSALGSYYYALAIPEHSHDSDGSCCFCNWMEIHNSGFTGQEMSEYNVFNFERYKWGGVRHTSPGYALFDLEQFIQLPKVTPTEEDWSIMRGVLRAAKELEPNQKAGALRQLITKKKLLKSNKAEVEVILDILGICGILSSPDAPSYCDHFANVMERSPREHTNDFTYPVNRWHASDGINEDRFQKVFGRRYSDL